MPEGRYLTKFEKGLILRTYQNGTDRRKKELIKMYGDLMTFPQV
tara:strand:- start:348 stop:479 length:132 start_codon:yes stop_codon:yes gene_type:complete